VSAISAAKGTISTSAPDALAQAHAQLIKNADLQFDFGTFQPEKPPEWLLAVFRFLALGEPVLKVLFWCVIAGLVATLVYFIGRELWYRRWPRGAVRPRASELRRQWHPTAQEALLLLSDADALAASGAFEKAVHLLLLRSIQDIDKHRPAVVTPSLTSREISLLGELPGSTRGAFANIVRVSERGLFGGRPVGASDFAACRAEYERFAFPEAWLAGARP
jgi:hypothetical protein